VKPDIPIVEDSATQKAQLAEALRVAGEVAIEQNRELQQARAELQALNATLEARVQERTAALNREMAERQRAEEEARASAELHRAILQTAPSGFWLVDLQGRLVEVNRSYCAMSGYSERELLGMYAFDLDACETAGDTAAHIQTVMAQGADHFESRHRRKDGSLYNVAVSVQFQPAAGGRLVCFLRDITERKQAAQELQRSQERLGLALRSAGAGVWDWDVASGRIEWSRELFTLFGLDPEHTTAGFDAWRQALHPEDRGEAAERIERALREGTPLASEYRVVHADGTVRWIDALGSTVRDPDGRPIRMSGICLDISARKQAQAVLEARLRLSDYAPAHTLEELLTRTLDEAEALTGSAIGFFHFVGADQKTVSLQAWSTRTRQNGCTVPGNRQHYPADLAGVWADALRERRPVIHNDYGSLPLRQGLPEGHCALLREVVVPILRHDLVVALLGLGNKPRDYVAADIESVLQLANLAWDIVQTKRAEEAQRRSEANYLDLVEQANSIVLHWTRDGLVTFLNEFGLRFFGYAEAEIVGRHIMGTIVPETESSGRDLRPLLDRICADPKAFEHNVNENMRRNGERVWVAWTNRIGFDDQGQVTGVLSVGTDITERRRAEAEQERLQARLQQAQRMESVGRLAGGVAHEFNNKLMGIMNYAELGRDELPPEHPTRHCLDEISSEAQRSADIARQLLAFARKQAIAPRPLNLNEALEGALKMVRHLLGEDIELAWVPGPGLWTVTMDPAQLEQILATLAAQARDAIAGVGKVTVATRNAVLDAAYCAEHDETAPGEYVMLTVSDSGRGMSQETIEHLFEPFFTTRNLAEDSSLGLATVYGIVRQNHGAVRVTSAPGQGTTFQVCLPRAQAPAAAQIDAARPGELPRGTETILVTEDETSIRTTAGLFLKALGYTVLTAAEPREALRLAAAQRGEIHLLITDVVMPGMNGSDLARQLAASRPGLKCLFMSGYAADAVAQRGVLDPDAPFLAKPFSRDTLARRVRALLDHGR
jgi:PAS domain S-box-containing protein